MEMKNGPDLRSSRSCARAAELWTRASASTAEASEVFMRYPHMFLRGDGARELATAAIDGSNVVGGVESDSDRERVSRAVGRGGDATCRCHRVLSRSGEMAGAPERDFNEQGRTT